MIKNERKQRILVIDDEPLNIKVLAQHLKDDFEVIIATNGDDGLDRAQLTPQPDLILLDVVMPDRDGYSVCRKLKSTPSTKEIPVIFITAKTDDSDEARGLEYGAIDYIKKPFNISVVMARVRTHLMLKIQRDLIHRLLKEKTAELEEYEKEYMRLFQRE